MYLKLLFLFISAASQIHKYSYLGIAEDPQEKMKIAPSGAENEIPSGSSPSFSFKGLVSDIS